MIDLDKPQKTVMAAREYLVNEQPEKAIQLLKTHLEAKNSLAVWHWLARSYQLVNEPLLVKAILRSTLLKMKNPHMVDIIAADIPYTKVLMDEGSQLIYYNIPKCGSSTIKDGMLLASGKGLAGGAAHFKVSHLEKVVPFRALGMRYRERYTSIGITRHPRDRLRSYWNKNINEKQSLRAESRGQARFYGLSTTPDYTEMLRHFDDYRMIFRDFRYHTDSIVGHLGKRPERIDHLFDIADTDKALAVIGDARNMTMPAIKNMVSSAPFRPTDSRTLDLEADIVGRHYQE